MFLSHFSTLRNIGRAKKNLVLFVYYPFKEFLSRDFLFYNILRKILLGQESYLRCNYRGTPVSPWPRVALAPIMACGLMSPQPNPSRAVSAGGVGVETREI